MSWLETVLRRRRFVVLAWVAAAAVAAPGLTRLAHDNSPEVFFVRDAGPLADYRRYAQAFGDDESLRIVLSGPGIWSRAGLEWLRTVELAAPRRPGALAAAGLWGYYRSSLPEWPPPDPAALRERALADPLLRNLGWVGAGGRSQSVLLALRKLAPAERRALLAGLEELLLEAPRGVRAELAGLPLVNRALDRSLEQIVAWFFPAIAVVTTLLLLLALRSAGDVLVPLLLVGFCQTVLFGVVGYLGAPFNVVTSILPPLSFVLVLATAVHLLLRVREARQRGLEGAAAVLEAYGEKGWPVFWTGVTTAVGFGSLAGSQAPPVRSLGLWSAFAIALLLLAAFTLYPALLAGAPAGSRRPPVSGYERAARLLGRRLAAAAVRRRRRVLLLFGLVFVAGTAGTALLRVETNVLSYFRPEHPVRALMEESRALGIGPVAAELLLELPPGRSFREPAQRERLAGLTERLRAEPLVVGAVSPADLLTAGELDDFRQRGLATLLSGDGATARISLFLPMLGYSRLEALFDRCAAAAEMGVPEARAAITGSYPMVLAAQRTMLRTMVTALAVTLLVVAVVLRLLLGGGRLAALALVPNLWPVALVLGVMGWLGVPAASATVMIASVALGLAVDDTLHFLGGFRRRTGRGAERAAVETLEGIAPAHLLTSAILAAGFGACALSDFVPVARFGALTALALVLALAADLILVPALLAGLPRRYLGRLAGANQRAEPPPGGGSDPGRPGDQTVRRRVR